MVPRFSIANRTFCSRAWLVVLAAMLTIEPGRASVAHRQPATWCVGDLKMRAGTGRPGDLGVRLTEGCVVILPRPLAFTCQMGAGLIQEKPQEPRESEPIG